MCNKACIDFGTDHVRDEDIRGKKVLEVGSYNVNGSFRSVIKPFEPDSYIGVDIREGPGVDEICSIEDIVTRYGKDSFDVVITTELMEHVRDWRKAVSNLKSVLKEGGDLIITTRSKGFAYHGYPLDFWRYEAEDMKAIFSDFSIEAVEQDRMAPGIFINAQKPAGFSEKNLDTYQLYSIVRDKRCKNIREVDILAFKLKRHLKQLFS